MNTDINARITSDVQQINSLAGSISSLNKQIVIGTAQGGGQAPNDLIDQRDQLVSNLSSLTGISTTTDSTGAVNVFVGNGQPLVLQGNVTQLTTVPNEFNASQLEVSTSTSNGNVISGSITSGDLGGLLAARSTVVEPAQNQLGQIATAFSSTVNSQQNVGLDLTGSLGANLFSEGQPAAVASSKNTGSGAASVSVASVGGLTTNNYIVTYKGGAYSLTNAADGSAVASSGTGTAANPLIAGGLKIVMSGTPAAGDRFLVQPTAQAAGSLNVALSNPSQIAAAAALQLTPAAGNTGTATFSATVLDPTNTSMLNTATVQFSSATTYTVTGSPGTFTVGAGNTIAQNGWQVQITGTPAAGDTLTVQSNAGATGDNRNALAASKQQSLPVLANGTVSINNAVSAMITGVGSQAQQINTAQTAQSAVNTQAVNNQQSVSGVNLDEEAANLLQWEQAYGAAAKALQIGSSLFTTLLTSLQAAG
jgi:flagellar hook-associated protein 1